MKAIRIEQHGGTDVLRLEDLPTPQPRAGEVLIEVKAIGINFADVLTRAGRYPMAPPPPLILGNEAAGIVVAVADDVVGWKPGDRVTGLWANSYAQFVVAPANRLISLPEDMSWEDAAAFPLQGITAYHLVNTVGKVRAGDRVLIHAAAGGVGLLLVQLCKQAGATVYGTSSSAQKATIAKQMGAEAMINYEEQDFVQAVKTLTNDLGVNVIFDSVGKATFVQGLESLAPLGRLVTFGTASGPADPVSPPSLFQKSLSISAFSLYSLYYMGGKLDLVQQAIDAVLEQLAAGSLKLTISRSFPLEDVAKAHDYVESRQSFGKVVLSV